MRLLITYGREFTRPRPYRLEDLPQAADMSISSVRTAYDDDEVTEVARLPGPGPALRPAEARDRRADVLEVTTAVGAVGMLEAPVMGIQRVITRS